MCAGFVLQINNYLLYSMCQSNPQDGKCKAVQCNSVHLFVLQLFKLGNFNILRNGLLHHAVRFFGEIGIEVFRQKVFCGTAASLCVQAAAFAAVNLSSQRWRSSFATDML